MASVSGGSLQTLDGISQLPGTVRSDYKHIEDDVTCSSSAMPISDGEGIQKSGQSIEVLRENLGSTMGCRPMTSRRKKDSLLLIEKPIFSRHQSNGTPHSPSDGSWTPRSGLSDSDAESYLNFKFETEDGQQSETRLERLNGLNRQWNDLHHQQKSYGNDLTEGVQGHLDDLEKGLETNSNSLANIDDMLPLEVQLEQVASSQDNLLALNTKLDDISEVAEMLVESALESPSEDAREGDGGPAVSGLQSQVVDLSKRFSEVLDQCEKRKSDILRRIEEEKSAGKSESHKKQTSDDLIQLTTWYSESYDLVVAEVFVTFDKSILKEILQQSQDIEEGSQNREKLVNEMLQKSGRKHGKTDSDVSSLKDLTAKFAALTQLAKKKVEDLSRLLKLSVKREQEIESLQSQVANLQKWVESRHTPPDLLVPAVIGVADSSSLSAQSTQDMQQAIRDEVIALESFMAEVHEEGLRFLKNTKPYNVKSGTLGNVTSPNEEDGSDSEQSSIVAESTTQFLNQWNYLKHRLEKRKAKINRQLLNQSKQEQPAIVSLSAMSMDEENSDRMTSLESRMLSVAQGYEADLSTKALQLQFQTLNSCWKSVISQVKEKDQRLTDILELQSKYLDSLNDAVLWLDSLELKIFSASLVKTCEEQLMEHEILFREMKAFESEFQLLNSTCNEVLSDAMTSPRREKAARMANEMQNRIRDLESAIKKKDNEVQLETINRQNQQKKLNVMFEKLEQLREQVLESLKRQDLSIEEKKQRCASHEAEHETLDGELDTLRTDLEAKNGADSLTMTQFNILEKLLDDIKFFINQFSSKVVTDEDLKEQMIKLISDYDSFLVSAETHMMSDTEEVSANSPTDLENHLKDFKSFFEDLDGHWHVLNGFYEQLEPGTKLKFAEEMARLNLRTIKVKDQASDLGKKFEVTLQQWTNVDQSMREVEMWLVRSERLPVLASSYDYSMLQVHSYEEACDLKQQLTDLQGELYVQESNAHKVLQDAKMLLRGSLKCPSVASKTEVFERMWKELFGKVNKKHERVFMLVETWARFESSIQEMFSWLERVMEKLDKMKSDRYSQMNAAELYLKLQSLMELGRDLIWNKMSVDRVRSIAATVQQICGNHFMPKEIDGKIVKLLSEWNYVNRELDVLKHNVQRYRHELMPLQQHLVELNVWMDGLSATLRQEDIKLIQWNGQHVKTKLHKFKGIELDLSWTQHDLDHVNQQAIVQSQKASVISVRSKSRFCSNKQDIYSTGSRTPRMYGNDILDGGRIAPREKSPYSTRDEVLPPQLDSQIGVLNQRWNDLRSQVKSNIQVLVEYDGLWRDYDSNVEKLLQWIEYKKLVIMRLHSGCGHLIGVRQGLAELKALETELEEMCAQFEAVHQLGDKLLGKHNHVTSLVVTENETRLYKAKNYLTSQILQLRSHLEQVEQNWLRYDSILEPISTKLSEAEFIISVHQTVSGTLQSYQQQLQNFRNFDRTLSALQNNLAQISNLTDEMCQLCGAPICEELRDNQKLLFDRWRHNVDEASVTVKRMEANERNWISYERSYEDIESRLQELKVSVETVEDALGTKCLSHTSGSTTQRKLSKDKIRRYVSQLQQVAMQMRMMKLEELAAEKEAICEVLDAPTRLQVDAKMKYLFDEFETTQLRCSKMESDLSSALIKHQEFEKLMSEVDLILKNCEDCSKKTIGDHKRKLKLRMDFIQEALSDLDSQSSVLTKANELASQIIVSDAEKIALKGCNSTWTSLTKDLRKRLEETEKIWLEQKSFSEKCQYWVDFVHEAGARLKEARTYIGSYEGFKQGYKDLQDLTNELVGKQPVMNSIVSEGRKLMFYEDETGMYSEQLKRKIEETKEEWKQTVQCLDEEKIRTTQILEKWINYKSDLSRMTQFLSDASDELDSLQSSMMLSKHSVPSQSHTSRLKHVDDQSLRRVKDFKKLMELAKVLAESSDTDTQVEIDQNLCGIKSKWNDLNSRIKNLKDLEADAVERDHEMEANIEMLQTIIKEANQQFETLLVDEMNSKIATVRFSDSFDLAVDDWKEQFYILSGLKKRFEDGYVIFEQVLTKMNSSKDNESPLRFNTLNATHVSPKLKERFALVSKQWDPLRNQIMAMADKVDAKIQICSQFQSLTQQIENSLTDCDQTLKQLAQLDDLEDIKSCVQTMRNTQLAFAKTSMKILTDDVLDNLRTLISVSNEGAFNDAKSRVQKLKQCVHEMDNISSKRVEKIREMLAASNELERKLEFLKRWFGRVENQLSQPIHVHSLDDEAFDHILNKHQELHQDIVNHTESVLSVIELCDMLDLDSESDIFPQLGGLQNESTGAIATSNNNSKFSKTSAMDLTLLRNRCRTVGKRWDRITAQSQDRLARINRAWDNCRKFLKSCEEFKEYIESFQTELSLLQNQSSPLNRLSSSSSVASRQLSQSTDEVIQQLSERRDEFNKSLGQLQAINEQYRILYHDAGVGISMVTSASHGKTSDSASELGPRTGLRNKLDEINKLWSDVSSEFDEAEVKLRRGLKQMEEFSQARQTLMMWLMDLDIRIDNIDKFFASDRLSDRVHQLKEIQRDVEAHQGRVDYLNLIGQRLIATFGGSSGYNSESDVNTQLGCVDSELKDFNMIAEKIKERLLKLSQKLNCSKDSFDSRRGKSVDSDVRSRGASSNLSPRSRALKHLQLKTLGNHNLLTSSSYDLRTSFSSTNQGSLIGFRKSASLSALNKDRCLTGTTTTTDSSERRSNIDLGSRSSKYSRSTDRRSLTCSAPRSIVSEDFSANIGYSYSSLFLENPFDSEKSSFFAHRPTLLPSDHNDLFLKRHDKGVVSIQSNGSGRSSPGMLQKLDGSVSGLDWDPYEPLQHSSDNLGLPPVPFTNCSSTTVNVDLNHNRSDFPSYHLTSHDRSHSTNSSSKFADPMKKQFTVKQKGVLLKFQPTIEDLKEALAECKTNLDGSEGFLRSPTPTGEMCEVVKVTFSGTIASCKASVDVVKSVYNKLQAQDPGIFHKSNYKNLSSSVEDCSQRWDVIKQRAMEKRRRLKHNYQLWNQFLADVTSLRNWIVQYRPTYPVSEHIAAPSSDLHSPEDISHRQFMRFLAAASNDRSSPSFNLKKKSLPLTHLEQLIGMHKEFMKDLNGNKTSLMSINMYLERYHSEDEVMEPREPYSGEHTRTSIKADVESLNVHFHELCHQALQTQLALQDCVINNEELNANLADIILWFETVEKAFEALQVKYNSKPPENVSAEVHAALLQLKAEVNTNQARVEALRSNAEQLLLFTNQTSFLVDSSSHSSSMHSKSSGLSSMSPYTEESSEFKERLYVLCSRVRSLKTKLSNSLELVESNAKMVRSDSSTSWERMPSMESASLDALVIPGTHSKLAALQNQSQLPLNDDNNNDDSFNRDAVVIQQTLHSHGADISCQSLSRNPQMPSKDPSSVNPQYLSRNPTNAPPHLGPSAYDSQQQLLIPHKKHVKQSLESTTPLEQLQSFSVEKILSTCEPYPANSVKIQGILMELLETSMLLPVSLECPWLQNSVRASSSATVSQTEKVSPNWKTRVAQWVSSNVKFIHFIILLLIFTHFIWRVSFLPSVNVSTPNTLLGINVELNYPHGPSPF